ncbi:hypothetical protein N9R44_00005, partial [Flavobacteriaceae bacterium]|nr:hypothetical protein [Flavobacteriaceae bacterium]
MVCLLLSAFLSNAQDIGVSNIVLVEGTLDTGVSSVTYELCATDSVSLQILLENHSSTSDTVSKVTLAITGVNSLAKAVYTISSTLTISGNSSVTVTYPEDFLSSPPALDFSNNGLSTITASTTSVSSTGDTDTDNDAFYIVGNVFTTDVPSLSSIQNGIACSGEEISFSISPSDGTQYTFYVNGALAYQGTDNSITFSTDPDDVDPLSDGAVITIGFTDANGCEAVTSSISQTVTIYDLPSAGLSAGSSPEAVCAGEEVTFTASGGTQYAFFKAGALVQAKSVSNTYTTSNLTNTQSITVTVYNANDCEDDATIAMEVLSITSAGSITFMDSNDSTLCSGSAPAGILSSTLAATGSHDLSYQWQSSPNGVDWDDIDGATGLNYTPPILTQTTYYKRLASVSTNTLSCSTDGDSNVLTITVNSAFDLSLTTPAGVYCLGNAINFEATTGAVSYTFLINGVSAQTSSTATLFATVSTSTSVASLTVKNNDIITVIAEDSNGCTVSETINVVSSSTPLNPSLDTDIPGNVLCSGETVAITASGGAFYAFTLNGLAPQAGEVSGNIFTTSRLTDEAVVEVTVTNAEGCTATTSMTFEVISLVTAGTVTITDSSELSVCYGAALTETLSSTAAATSSDSVHYQWQSSTDGSNYVNITGENNENLDLSSLPSPNLTTTTYFKRQAFAYIDSNSSGSYDVGETTCSSGKFTVPIIINVDAEVTPTITSSTGAFTFCEGASVTFSSPTAGVATYTWTYNDGSSTTSSTGTGTSTDVTIGIANGWIDLEVTTTAGCLYSVREPVTVAPAINTTLTAPTTICPSDSIDISVVPTSLATYTFFIGGAQVQESSSATLTTTGITQTSSVVIQITNSAGCIETVSTTINVIDLDDGGDITSLITTICSGASSPLISNSVSATLESYSAAATITYFWEQSYDTLSWTPIPLEVGSSLPAGALTNITSTTHFRRVAQIEDEDGDLCETLYSNTNVTITVEAAITPTITSSTGAFTFCEGASVTFSSPTAGVATYTWTYNDGSSTTSSTGTGTSTDVTIGIANGWIDLEVTTTAGCLYSVREPVTVAPAINTTLTAPTTICPSDSIDISVVPTSLATYTFFIGGAQVQESSSATLTTTGITQTSSVVIQITNSAGCIETVSTTINVIDLDDGGDITSLITTICSGASSPLISNSVSATLESYSAAATITYFWEQSYDTLSWTPIPLEVGSSLPAGALTNITSTTHFRRVAQIEDEDGDLCETLYSNTNVTITVEAAITPTITSSTGAFTFCEGVSVANFSASPAGQATYTWTYFNGTTTTSSTSGSSGTTTQVTLVNSGWIKLDISTLSGCVYSATQSFTVNPDLNVNISPDSYTICQGGGVVVTVNNPVGAYTYTYIKEGVAIAAATNITTASYTITNLNDGDIIAVEATDNSTGCTGTSSFTLNVISALSSVGSITRADTDILCSGEVPSTIFGDGTSGSASATTTTGTITYQWYYKTAAMANFAITGSDPIRDQSINYSPSALSETTTFKRLASVILNGVSCSDSFSLTEEIVVYDAEGGTLDSTSASMCFSFGDPAPTITVTGSSVGNYQWQDSSDGIVFANVPSAQLTDFTPTITATGTYYYRRVTTVGTCSDTTDVFTLTVGETDAGSLDTAPSGVYCYGTQPPQLGIGTSVNGSSGLNAVTYRWESKIDGAIGGYNEIIGETNRAYQPPPLFASPTEDTTVYLYRRVTLSLGGCESVPSNVVSITISPEIEVGYLNFQNVDPDNYFICQGQDVENLVLINATPVQAGVVTYTWQESTDLIVWTEVASSSSNSNLNFGTSNTPSVTTYYRVKITSGEGSPDSGTSVLNILLTETSETPTIGEVYSIYIEGYEARVTTTAAVSTTDTLGAALAASITSSVTGYTATYFADENIIEIDNYTTDVTISRSSSSTLFSAPILLSYDSSEDFCSAYTNVVGVTIYEEPLIQQTGGSIDSQVICLNSAIDPVTFNVTGSYDYVVITGISDVFDVTASGSGSATYSTLTGAWTISNTSAFTITGTPTLAANQSLLIQIETSGSCDEEAVFNYRIETVQSPNDPDIIYRNNPQNSRALNNRHQIFQSGGTWFNNTVAQDSDDVLPDNAPLTYEFAACYSNNQDLRYVKFDWQILPVSAVQSITYKNDNDTTMQAIITASYDSSTVTFTVGSDYVITITSPDGSTNDVTFTTVQDDITENLDDLDNDLEGLPSISSSRSGNVITLTADTPGEAGYFSIQVQNPDNAEIFINSPEYLYPEQDNAIEVIFNPDFGTQTPTITSGGVTATLRVRAESIECDDVFSDWYEVELYVVSEQNPVANFPNIREPEVLSRNYCGVNSNDTVPACEVDTESNLESTFYAAAESGEDNDYAYLEWKIDNVAPGDPSAPFPGRYFTYNNGIDPDYGTISWAPGFHGQFDVCVRAVACDGTTDTWECYSYVISPESEMPDVFALNIPVCPITANTVTSTFTSNLMVNWTITPLSAIASTSTRTVNGLDAFDVVWEEGYSGMVWLTADVKDCAGDPRYYTVRIPENPNLTRTSTPTVQTVCQGDQILPITYSVSGYSVLGINDAELPLGLTGVYSSTVQEATIRVFQRTLSVDDSDNKYILAVDYNDYAYEADGTESLTEITEAITSMVVSSTLVGTATSTTSNNSSTIIITGATPGIRFNIASNTPETSRYTISQPVIANLNGTYTVSGSVSETLTTSSSSYRGVGPSGTSQVHEFDLTIISSSASCTTVTETVVIYYNPKGSIATATPTLLTQYICDGDSLEEIEFELSGGATDYDPVVWYPAEPNGIEFSPESGDVLGVGTSFTLSGTLNTGVTTTTVYYYTITTNGSICDTGSISGTLVVYPKEEVTQVPASNQQFCVSEYLNLEFNFEGISALVVSTTSSATFNSLGLSSSWTYTSTPSVALTVVTSATAVNEIYQIEIIDELGAIRAHQYTSVTGSESTTTIASELRASINSTNPFVTASISNTDSSVIDITADNNNYVFWTRVNVEGNAGTIEHNDGARMRVTDAIPVEGYLSITGTPTVSITETASYSLVISTPGNLCSQASVTFEFDLIPDQSISITSSPTTQNQNICDGEEIDDVTFFLEGLTTGYSFSWSNGAPNGLDFDPLSQNLFGTSTITLSGSLNTGVTTTTVYYYTLNTTGTTCAIGTVTGSIVVYPKEEILLPPNSPITYDITDFVDLEYTFEGVSSLTLTASSSADLVALGLTSSNSYTTTPSVELTIVSSPTVAQQIYSVELVQEDRSSSRYFYQVSSTTESITSITAELANLIDQNGNVIAVVSDTDSSVINISANDQDYIFWIRINEGQTAGSVAHYDEATMRITNAVPVQGVFSLTGTPTVSITETTSYTFTIVTPGIQCTTDSETTVVIIKPEAQITLTSSLTTLNQELTNTSSIDSVTFLIGGDADSYTIEWPNGAPTGLSISPVSGALAGTNTLTLSGELDTATTTTTVFYYTITAFDGLEEGDSISGSVVVHPDEIISLSPPGVVSYCNSDLISLSYQFEGFRSLSVSSTSSSTIPNLGIISELTYSTTPTVLITVVASATSLNEDYQIEIVQEDGNSTAFNYQSTTATESISSIANGLAAEINATNSAVVATVTSGGSISIEAVSSSYVFWIRINQGSVAGSMENYEDSRIRVTGAIAVKGEFTVTGTPTILVTATTSYSLIVVSPGLRVGTDSTSATTIITLEPEQLISLTSSSTTLNQVLCDNTAIDDVVFQLSGNATGFTGLNWIGNIPGGILQPALGVSNTITLTGTITTGVTTTTVYVYSITTTGNSCESNTVTGSFTVNPDHYITLDVDSESDQTVCDLSAIDPIEFEISGGATGVSVDWPSGNPGLNIYLSNSSSTTYVISGTLNTSVATETIYVYTVTTIGNSCTEATLSGQITVIPQLIINVDSPLTQSQMGSNALCNGDDIQAIDFSFTSGNSPTLFLDWTDSSGVSIGSPGPALSGYSIRGPITTSSTELTTYYYTLRAVQTNGSCVFTDEFNGTLQVSPDIIVHENYIRVNDVTDVSCPLGNDGSIIIPSTPESEFQLRIEGGQTASAQIDKVALLVSDTLDGGDQISVIIDGITFTSVVASGTTTQTMLEELRDKVNFGTGSDNVAVTAVVINDGSEVYLQLTADTAGSSFVASGTTITSLVTGTTVVSTLVENENLNYEYTWTRDGALVGSTLSIENLIAGTYTLAVSINGCQASSTYSFEIQQPSISVGTISETCNGDISVPISAYLTASQLAIPGTKVTAELYELGSDNTYSELFGTQNFSTSLATNTFAANFYSLAQGEMYQLVV